MSAEDHMTEARQLAAQCWCDDDTAEITMNPAIAEAFAKRIAVLLHKIDCLTKGAPPEPVRTESFFSDLPTE